VATGTSYSVKILGIPAYTPGTKVRIGKILQKWFTGLLIEWGSTASICKQYRPFNWACVTTQHHLEWALLWPGCHPSYVKFYFPCVQWF